MATKRERDKRQKVDAREWAKKVSEGNEGTCVKLPEGWSFYKLEPNKVLEIDFMSFLAGKNNYRADEGMVAFEAEYDAHRIPVGDKFRLYACRQKCFKGKKCAGCDWLRDNGGKADPKLLEKVRATTRHLWIVNENPGNPKGPFKVLDTNHFNKKKGFGEQMAALIQSDEDYMDFADPENGMLVKITTVEDTFPGGKYTLASRIDFKPRKKDGKSYSYPDSIIDDMPCLDECIIDPGYEPVMELLNGGPPEPDDEDGDGDRKPKGKARDEDNEDDDRPARRKPKDEDDEDDEPAPKKKPKDEDDPTAEDLGLEMGDDVEHRKYGKCTILKVSGDGTSLRLKDEDGEVYNAVAPRECKKIEDEPAPKKKPKDEDEEEERPQRRGKAKPKDDDDDEPPAKKGKPADDDDEDDDDPPARKPAGKKGKDLPFDEDDDAPPKKRK